MVQRAFRSRDLYDALQLPDGLLQDFVQRSKPPLLQLLTHERTPAPPHGEPPEHTDQRGPARSHQHRQYANYSHVTTTHQHARSNRHRVPTTHHDANHHQQSRSLHHAKSRLCLDQRRQKTHPHRRHHTMWRHAPNESLACDLGLSDHFRRKPRGAHSPQRCNLFVLGSKQAHPSFHQQCIRNLQESASPSSYR